MDEFSWAVGFFEGEGCICLSRYKNKRKGDGHHRSLTASSTDLENIERFQRAVGVGQIHNPQTRTDKPHHKTIHRWCLTRWDHIEALLYQMLPHLSSRRQAAARAMLDNPVVHGRLGGHGAYCRIFCKRGHHLTATTQYFRKNGKRCAISRDAIERSG